MNVRAEHTGPKLLHYRTHDTPTEEHVSGIEKFQPGSQIQLLQKFFNQEGGEFAYEEPLPEVYLVTGKGFKAEVLARGDGRPDDINGRTLYRVQKKAETFSLTSNTTVIHDKGTRFVVSR